MAKRPKKKALNTAEAFANYLLYTATGGNLGEKPEKEFKNEGATFGELRGLLDSLIKIASLERESEADEEAPSGFDAIKRQLAKERKFDASRETWGSGNTESAADSAASNGNSDETTTDA